MISPFPSPHIIHQCCPAVDDSCPNEKNISQDAIKKRGEHFYKKLSEMGRVRFWGHIFTLTKIYKNHI
jgi:hypothetical protein